MSADIVRIYSETLLGFVRRVGCVRTSNVAGRFGWTHDTARVEMARLVALGQVERLGFVKTDNGNFEIEWRANP